MSQPAGRDPLYPTPVLDGDCLSCSECGATRLVAEERVEVRYTVDPTAALPLGSTGKPVIRLRAHERSEMTGVVIRCGDCGATLFHDDFEMDKDAAR